jgi:hypothetical protein
MGEDRRRRPAQAQQLCGQADRFVATVGTLAHELARQPESRRPQLVGEPPQATRARRRAEAGLDGVSDVRDAAVTELEKVPRRQASAVHVVDDDGWDGGHVGVDHHRGDHRLAEPLHLAGQQS